MRQWSLDSPSAGMIATAAGAALSAPSFADTPQANYALIQVSTAASNAHASGAKDEDILRAVVGGRRGTDPFYWPVEYQAGMVGLFGPLFTLVIQVAALLYLIAQLLAAGQDLIDWVVGNLKTVLVVGAAIAGMWAFGPFLLSLFDEDPKKKGMRLGTAAMKGLITGFLPSPIKEAVMALEIEMGGTWGIGAGGAPALPTTTPHDVRLSDEQIDAVADRLGVERDDLMTRLTRPLS